MAIATFQPIADLLAEEGVAKQGAAPDLRRRRLPRPRRQASAVGPAAAATPPTRFARTSWSPRPTPGAPTPRRCTWRSPPTSPTATRCVQRRRRGERRCCRTLSQALPGPGLHATTRPRGRSTDYLSLGMGKTPLVCVYEAQYVDAAVRGTARARHGAAVPVADGAVQAHAGPARRQGRPGRAAAHHRSRAAAARGAARVPHRRLRRSSPRSSPSTVPGRRGPGRRGRHPLVRHPGAPARRRRQEVSSRAQIEGETTWPTRISSSPRPSPSPPFRGEGGDPDPARRRPRATS